MCSVTWLREADGYQLFFNRDEKKTRRPAVPPARFDTGGVRHIHPVDGTAGGTWIGVNEFGLAVCLLNHHPHPAPGAPPPPPISRGHLPPMLLDARSAGEVMDRLMTFDLAAYRPFILLALDAASAPRALVSESGARRQLDVRGEPFLTTSSFQSSEVAAARRNEFARCFAGTSAITAPRLMEFHRSHAPEAGPYSVCMHREDAQTVSFSHLVVNAGEVRLAYADGSPCRASLSPPVVLARRR
jgi:hypothetical protein